MAGQVWRLLPARAEAVPLARQSVATLEVDRAAANVVELLTSEVVTNAVRHGPNGGDDQISLVARIEPGCVMVEVCDEGTADAPALGGDEPLEPGGLGLRLVDSLATEWGTRRDVIRCVWFRVAA